MMTRANTRSVQLAIMIPPIARLPVGGVNVQNLDVPVCIVDPVNECVIPHDHDLHHSSGSVVVCGVGDSARIIPVLCYASSES